MQLSSYYVPYIRALAADPDACMDILKMQTNHYMPLFGNSALRSYSWVERVFRQHVHWLSVASTMGRVSLLPSVTVVAITFVKILPEKERPQKGKEK